MWEGNGTAAPTKNSADTGSVSERPVVRFPEVSTSQSVGHSSQDGLNPKLENAVSSLDELLEAELAAVPKNLPEENSEADARSAILAAFENTLKTETVVQDVSLICEELIDLSDRDPIPMPEVANWPESMPASRFGEGEQLVSDGIAARFIKMPSRRMVAVSSASLLFLTVASFAYLDPEAALDVVTMAVPEANAPNSLEADIQPGSTAVDPKGVLVASAGKFKISDGEPEVLKDAPMARLAVETIVPQNVSVIEKSPEVVDSVTTQQQLADLVAEARLAKTLIKPAIGGTQQLTLEARSNEQTSGLAFAPRSREIAASAGRFLAVDNVKTAKETRKPAMVLRQASFVVNRDENKPLARTGKPVVPALTASEKRDEYTVQQAMLNAKGLNTLSGAQQKELVPKLVGGECVASALKSVAGRVSPILMRDLLTNLNSDC